MFGCFFSAGRKLAQATSAEAEVSPEAPGTEPISDGSDTATSEELLSLLLPASEEEASPETETEPESEAEPEGELEAEAETAAEPETDPESAADPEVEAEAEPEAEAEAEAGAEAEAEAGAEAGSEAGAGAEAEAEPEAEPEGAAEPEMPVVEGEATPSGHFAIGEGLAATGSLCFIVLLSCAAVAHQEDTS